MYIIEIRVRARQGYKIHSSIGYTQGRIKHDFHSLVIRRIVPIDCQYWWSKQTIYDIKTCWFDSSGQSVSVHNFSVNSPWCVELTNGPKCTPPGHLWTRQRLIIINRWCFTSDQTNNNAQSVHPSQMSFPPIIIYFLHFHLYQITFTWVYLYVHFTSLHTYLVKNHLQVK